MTKRNNQDREESIIVSRNSRAKESWVVPTEQQEAQLRVLSAWATGTPGELTEGSGWPPAACPPQGCASALSHLPTLRHRRKQVVSIQDITFSPLCR